MNGNKKTDKKVLNQRTDSSIAEKIPPRQTISSKRRKTSFGKKRKKGGLYTVCAVGGILVAVCIFLLCRACSDKNNMALLNGNWRYNESAVYEFDGKGNGCMCINDSDHYEFTYQVRGKKLSMDYALDYVTDCEYTFKISGEKLTLIGGEGTAEIGKEYELTKE